ncbi:SGNH/GDSL hydrolase family protein [Streptomyces sp. NPDC055400]
MSTSEPAAEERAPSWWRRRRDRRAAQSRARRMVGRCLTALSVCVVLVLVAAGAGVAVLYRQGTRPPGGTGEYVALGSSFAAGPGVGQRAANSPALCARSDANYAQPVAHSREMSLTDVTCSGATTHDVLDGGQFFQPAQVDAVRSTTRLVTVTIGGNDVSYLGNLVAWSCGNARDRVPLYWRPMVCSATPRTEVDDRLDRLPGQLDRIAQQVHRRAPRRGSALSITRPCCRPRAGAGTDCRWTRTS